ncbi:MAG: right-handed parallel beta-helix repeat-containing protein [Actinobacteria bacterium]|nr:right-handed parallel beta-helix repeat-containing protein [Actinomycetota bacterium]
MRAGRLRGAAATIAGVVVVIGASAAVAPAAWAHDGENHRQGPEQELVVSVNGHDSATCGRADDPCRTIGQAVKNAPSGGEVEVHRGTYTESVTVNKRLELVGEHATIDASGMVNGISLTSAASWSEVRGFKVENAIGEGILSTANSGVQVSWNEVTHNDTGASDPHTTDPLCLPSGQVPGDCGEALHLDGTVGARVEHNFVHDNVGGILIADDAASSHNNWITHNLVKNNKEDCGITMPSHSTNTVHDNVIAYNTSTGNGAAGVLIAASGPGDNDFNNVVKGNRIWGNGEGGVQLHAHAPGQNIDGNKILDNWIGTNNTAGDMDFNDLQTTGIIVASAVVPVKGLVVHDNTIANNHFGMFLTPNVNTSGINDNEFHNDTVNIQQ